MQGTRSKLGSQMSNGKGQRQGQRGKVKGLGNYAFDKPRSFAKRKPWLLGRLFRLASLLRSFLRLFVTAIDEHASQCA